MKSITINEFVSGRLLEEENIKHYLQYLVEEIGLPTVSSYVVGGEDGNYEETDVDNEKTKQVVNQIKTETGINPDVQDIHRFLAIVVPNDTSVFKQMLPVNRTFVDCKETNIIYDIHNLELGAVIVNYNDEKVVMAVTDTHPTKVTVTAVHGDSRYEVGDKLVWNEKRKNFIYDNE